MFDSWASAAWHSVGSSGQSLSSGESLCISKGSYARMKGLVKVPKFNGKVVIVVRYMESKKRWRVKLLNERRLRYLCVKEEHLQPITAEAAKTKEADTTATSSPKYIWKRKHEE